MAQDSKVTFYKGTQEQYNSLSAADSNGIYFLSDTKSIYQGDTKYGGGDGVDIATSTTAGIVKPGTDFDIAADGTLSLYQPIDITSFSSNIPTQEKGAKVESVTLSWNWNKTPASQTLKKGSESYSVAASDKTKTISFSSTAALTTNTTFTLTATDARSASDSQSTTIQFLNGRYYGIGNITDPSLCDNSFIQGLTKTLASSRTTSFTVTAGSGQYIYFAIPSSFGTPSFFVGGFEGGFDLFKTFSYTNPSNYAESYTVYKSTNPNLGTTTVEVK